MHVRSGSRSRRRNSGSPQDETTAIVQGAANESIPSFSPIARKISRVEADTLFISRTPSLNSVLHWKWGHLAPFQRPLQISIRSA